MNNTGVLVALTCCGLVTVSSSASAQPPSQALLACAKIQDATERVRCYDAQVAAMKPKAPTSPAPNSQSPAAGVPPAAAAAVSSSAVTSIPAVHAAAALPPARPPAAAAARTQAGSAEAQFGDEYLPAGERPQGDRPQFIVSRITALHAQPGDELGAKRYDIALANGQLWRQVEVDPVSTFFRVGDPVRIQRGGLGAYRLSTATTGKKNWVQVIRVQ